MMIDDDNDCQMIFGDVGVLKLPDICLTGEEKPRKNLTQDLVPTGDLTRARCVTGAPATTWPTAMDSSLIGKRNWKGGMVRMSSNAYTQHLLGRFNEELFPKHGGVNIGGRRIK